MSKAKFTKGPWVANGVFVGTTPKTDDIVSGVGIRTDGETYANAHLIAAAPEMYELLSDFLRNHEFGRDVDNQISALLAKARGEQ